MRSVLRLRAFSVHSCPGAQLSATFSTDTSSSHQTFFSHRWIGRAGLDNVYLQVYDVQRRVIHEKIHTLTKFLVHTTNVQCVRPWSPSIHPNSNPVPSRHSIACFRHSSSDAFLQCLQRCWHWGYINFVIHITPWEEIMWRKIWRPGGPWQQMNLIQTNAPYPAMWQFSVEKVACHLASIRATRRAFKLGKCMYLLMYHPSFYVAYL
ncbi:hypothetical protein AVEN_249859-1 [Araneus ventricosus]|uniref:Uncharacterized protein n=1 Tax=Araneus ventricosus TaxID=182803 RepID=A0A4Y2LE77_ARAVE|nr:hypothetical protein AVEN_249859-1 [Araneus ventricosus]